MKSKEEEKPKVCVIFSYICWMIWNITFFFNFLFLFLLHLLGDLEDHLFLFGRSPFGMQVYECHVYHTKCIQFNCKFDEPNNFFAPYEYLKSEGYDFAAFCYISLSGFYLSFAKKALLFICKFPILRKEWVIVFVTEGTV